MNILCVGYRSWAIDIYKELKNNLANKKFHIELITDKSELTLKKIDNFNPEFIFFYGWSWMVQKEIYIKFKCIALHPSKLPKYRGGSPIQHQIINGEKKSAVTLFKVDKLIDSGPIYFQEEFSLAGSIEDIFERIKSLGLKGSLKIILENIKPVDQDHDQATFFNRRTEDESEITIKELIEESSEYIYNKIRMLEDPYPNAFIRLKDGKKIIINKASLD